MELVQDAGMVLWWGIVAVLIGTIVIVRLYWLAELLIWLVGLPFRIVRYFAR